MLPIDKTYPWFVPVGGYRVHTPSISSPRQPRTEWTPDAYLIEARSGASLGRYEVWDEPALYLRFAALPLLLDDASWLGFANKYGPLRIKWLPQQIGPTDEPALLDDPEAFFQRANEKKKPYRAGGAPEIFNFTTETRADWMDEAGAMSVLISRWREVSDGHRIDQEFVLHAIATVLNGDNFLLDDKRPTDPEGLMEISLKPNPETNGPGVSLVPRSLIGAMWMQFADDVVAGARYRTCEACPNEFAVFPSDRRTMRRKTCSSACRTRLSEEGMRRDD